ncbi:hypothetical protein [Actinoplanes aureus]|uniref:Uncharacterized protein n=1 Tax=Actinoplanes aureus TaxID=2792083 RepID=A0A931G3S0_9ACTN|nr:hypothetical protein [Actinoplanes aureus]MBG0569172.1 hypothetical protein [Actinoplanes aureus]
MARRHRPQWLTRRYWTDMPDGKPLHTDAGTKVLDVISEFSLILTAAIAINMLLAAVGTHPVLRCLLSSLFFAAARAHRRHPRRRRSPPAARP